MIYIFYGTNEYLLQKEITKILEKSGIDAFNTVKYDLETTLLEDILKDASSISLFSSKKAILIDNAYIFTGTTNKKLLEQNPKLLENYFQNPNPDTLCIFTILKDKLDERKKIVKLAKEKGYLKEFNKESNYVDIVIELFDDYQITKKTAEFFVERVGKNLAILQSEIQKIKLYKDENKTIEMQDIIELTSKNIDTDIFHLVENIILKKKEQALESYYEMIKLGEEPIMILIMVANQFRMIYQVKKLYQKGYSENDISKELKVHWYPVRKAMEKMRNYDENILLKYLHALAELDIQIKAGTMNKELGLEVFILTL